MATVRGGVTLLSGVGVSNIASDLGYEMPDDTIRTVINTFSVYNRNASTLNLIVYIVEEGESANSDNSIVATQINPGETRVLDEMIGSSLTENATIWGVCGSDQEIRVFSSGTEFKQ